MSKPKRPAPPAGLKRRGKALWRSILADLSEDWELDARELAFLERACCCSDEMAELEKSIDRDGITVHGSKGQLRVHPALVEVRQLRLAQLRLLGSIELTDPHASLRASTPAQLQARNAARSRWADHERRGRARGAA